MAAFNNTAILLLYVVVAMIADWHSRERIHPAFFWGAVHWLAWACPSKCWRFPAVCCIGWANSGVEKNKVGQPPSLALPRHFQNPKNWMSNVSPLIV
jgi:hypothetical protein